MEATERKTLWRRLGTPAKIGLAFGLLGAILAAIGMFSGFAPMTFRAFATAILVSGLAWGIVAWAMSAAAVEVERDVAEPEDESVEP